MASAMINGRRVCSLVSLLTLVFSSVHLASQVSAWLDVPFVQQTRKLCGPACVAMIMAYWDRRAERDPSESRQRPSFPEICNALDTSNANGVSGEEIGRYFNQAGFQTYIFQGTWNDVQDHLLRGRPLLIALGMPGGNNHYVVLVGWDWRQGVVLVNDPARRKLTKMSRPDFDVSWQRTGCWTLLSLPKTGSMNVSSTEITR